MPRAAGWPERDPLLNRPEGLPDICGSAKLRFGWIM